jgi:hypothetical protein
METETLKNKINDVLKPIWQDIIKINANFTDDNKKVKGFCGYMASIITIILKEELAVDNHTVRLALGAVSAESHLLPHFFTEVDGQAFVCSTFGQFKSKYENSILVDDLDEAESKYDLDWLNRNIKPTSQGSDLENIAYDNPLTIDTLYAQPDCPLMPGFYTWIPEKKDRVINNVRMLRRKLAASREGTVRFGQTDINYWMREQKKHNKEFTQKMEELSKKGITTLLPYQYVSDAEKATRHDVTVRFT